jgi:hypothetical protein
MLAVTPLLTVLDSIAKGVELFENAVGILGSESTTVGLGAANNVATLIAIADDDVQADLVAAFRARAANVLAGVLYGALGGANVQRVLNAHFGASGGGGSLNAFLTTSDKRVHPNLRKIGMQIDSVNAFCPTAVDPVAGFAVSGSGAGTFTAGSDIDTSLYGKAKMVVHTTTAIGASTITATLTMKKIDGTTTSKVVTIPNGTAINTDIAIGTPGTDLYVGCSAIAITGGTSGEGFKVVSQVERTIAL